MSDKRTPYQVYEELGPKLIEWKRRYLESNDSIMRRSLLSGVHEARNFYGERLIDVWEAYKTKENGMSEGDKYCPAGKIECSNHTEDVCVQGKKGNTCGYYTDMWEQCPWPSKQKPIEEKKIEKICEFKPREPQYTIRKKLNEVIDCVNELMEKE